MNWRTAGQAAIALALTALPAWAQPSPTAKKTTADELGRAWPGARPSW